MSSVDHQLLPKYELCCLKKKKKIAKNERFWPKLKNLPFCVKFESDCFFTDLCPY